MEKEEIKNKILLCVNGIEKHIKENTINTLSPNYKFLIAMLNESFDPFEYRDLVLWARTINEQIDMEELCDLIYLQYNKISWIDFIPYKLDTDEFVMIVKLVPFGDCSETKFHCSFERYRHYPIKDKKYDINYFWQISDNEYDKREKEWRKRCKKILIKSKIQKWIAIRLYKYFGKKIEIIDLEKEMEKINVFS